MTEKKSDRKSVFSSRKVAKTESTRKPRNYNIGYIRRSMREYCSGQYRIGKDVPMAMAHAIDKYIHKLTLNAAEFSLIAGRCTIKAEDVYAALRVEKREEKNQ